NAALQAGTNVSITTGTSGAQAGNITVSSAILQNVAGPVPTLTLNAAGSIAINNTISTASASDFLNLNLIAGGNITQTAAINLPSGIVTATAATGISLNLNNTVFGINLTNPGTSAVAFTNTMATLIGGINVGSGGVTLVSGGTISETGP